MSIHPVVQEFIDFKELQLLKLVNREIQFKKFIHLVEETKQEAIEESGLSKKEFLKQVSNG
jgi:ABC-type phosphate transport system auxiliary subunit